MSVEPAGRDGKDYCSPEDILAFFPKLDDFDEETKPTLRQVRSRISARTEYIDSYTNHAWRERRMKNEMKDLQNNWRWRIGMPIKLQKRDIRTPLDSGEGDKLEVWEGNEYTDMVSSNEYEESRDGDYWIEESTGMLYVYRRNFMWNKIREFRVTYRYGKETVPADIVDACAKLVVSDLMLSDQYRVTLPGNDEAPDVSSTAESYREEAHETLDRYKELQIITN